MARIYAPVQDYNGISAGVQFNLGVGSTTNVVAIAWFKAHGYTVEDTVVNLDTLDKLNKDVLIEMATELEVETADKTKAQLVAAIKALFVVGTVTITSSKTLSIVALATSQITSTVAPTTAYDQDLVYISSDEEVATVSATGLITGVAVGEATITVASQKQPTVKDTIALTVTAE